MGGPNLEVFKFGLYIMFPISFMYYFGTNLDSRFSVPDFWPRPEATYKIPFDREEISSELEMYRQRRLRRRTERLERESLEGTIAERTTSTGKTALPWWFPGDLRSRVEAEKQREVQRLAQTQRPPRNRNEAYDL